jgi:hypothetical protein
VRPPITEVPEGFDRWKHPILARHWFGVEPPPTSVTEAVADLRFERQVRLLHRLGPRPVAELLAELGAERNIQTIIDRKLARYTKLTPEQLRATGGDRFPPTPIHRVRP